VLYYILGQTHPVIKKVSGETYRKSLATLIEKIGH